MDPPSGPRWDHRTIRPRSIDGRAEVGGGGRKDSQQAPLRPRIAVAVQDGVPQRLPRPRQLQPLDAADRIG